jgi:hypothetical protein
MDPVVGCRYCARVEGQLPVWEVGRWLGIRDSTLFLICFEVDTLTISLSDRAEELGSEISGLSRLADIGERSG